MGHNKAGTGVGLSSILPKFNFLNLPIFILERKSASLLALELKCLAKTLTFSTKLCKTNILINTMHCLQVEVQLFTILQTLSLSQNRTTLLFWNLCSHWMHPATKAKSSRYSILGLNLLINSTFHLLNIQEELQIAPKPSISLAVASENMLISSAYQSLLNSMKGLAKTVGWVKNVLQVCKSSFISPFTLT